MHQRFTFRVFAILLAAAGLASPQAAGNPGPRPTMEVFVGGKPVPTYHARGTVYIEALKGREYEIRLRNPYPVRVAVALSVDGLNTIDARHTTAEEARKWVIEPYGTVTISGWQTSMSDARHFEFTTEQRSYGAWLGKTNDLGVISAVFYRERVPQRLVLARPEPLPGPDAPAPADGQRARSMPAAEAGALPSSKADAEGSVRAPGARENEYAATGIGRRTEHAVRQVALDLEPSAAASISVRYEFGTQLVRLGVIPPRLQDADPLERRERARGFEGFCPDPKR
jgi:hypothetical protein